MKGRGGSARVLPWAEWEGGSRVQTGVFYQDRSVTLCVGDAVEVLTGLPAASVDCVVTSPPYWRLRDYGTTVWQNGNARCQHKVAGLRTSAAGTRAAQSADARCVRCGATGKDRQYGFEATLHDYIDRLRAVFAQLRRVLVEGGTVWLHLGDRYSPTPPTRISAAHSSQSVPTPGGSEEPT